eukprot:1437061-Alexandrium_andersonii.AAC.1
MSGVLQDSSGFLSDWFDKLHQQDLNKFQAQAGGAPVQRTLRGPGRASQPPDSLGALAALQLSSTPSVALNTIAQEFALDDALGPYPLAQLRHILGVSNDVADASPRQFAPDAKAFPV